MESPWSNFAFMKDESGDFSGSDSEISGDEETWLKELQLLKEYGERGGALAASNSDNESSQSDGLSIVSRLADGPPTCDSVLLLNKIIICILMQMESRVLAKLRQNVLDQEGTVAELRKLKGERSTGTILGASFTKCGMPFFTWCDNWSQSKNTYVKEQEKFGCATPEQHFKGVFCWSPKENKKLYDLVIRLYKEEMLLKLENEVQSIVRSGGDPEALKKAKLLLANLRGGNADFHVDSRKVDWMRVSAALGATYSPQECQAQWSSYLSPEINRSRWTREERDRLSIIAKAHGFQSWDKIAEELGTSRTGLMCCITFQRMRNFQFTRWTPDDDNKLRDLMKRFCNVSVRSLLKISSFFEDKSPKQIRKRYYALIGPNKKIRDTVSYKFEGNQAVRRRMPSKKKLMNKMPNFSCDDDRLLFEAVKKHGKNWTVVAEAVPGRQPEEVKHRCLELLKLGQEVVKAATGTPNGAALLPPDKDAWTVLQMIWERKQAPSVGKRYGLPLNECMSLATQRLLRVLEFGHRHLFGPRFSMPRNYDQRYTTACLTAFICDTLSTTFVPDTAADRLLRYVPNAGRPEDNLLAMREVVIPAPALGLGRCFIPPNVMTLLGARVLSSSRGLLTGQAALPALVVGTAMSQDIPPEERLLPCNAKQLLKDRMFSLFFLSLIMARVSRSPGQYAALVATERKRSKQKKKLKPLNRAQKKKLAKRLNSARWKNDTEPKTGPQVSGPSGEDSATPAKKICKPGVVQTFEQLDSTYVVSLDLETGQKTEGLDDDGLTPLQK